MVGVVGFSFLTQPGALSAIRQMAGCLLGCSVGAAHGVGQCSAGCKSTGGTESIYLDDGAGAGSLSL